MSGESQNKEAMEQLPVIKQLFQTRHYIQCAVVCERLLTRSNEVCFPHDIFDFPSSVSIQLLIYSRPILFIKPISTSTWPSPMTQWPERQV